MFSLSERTKRFCVFFFFAFWFLYFTSFWVRAFHYDEQGNVVVGHPIIWADWAAHFSIGASMVERSLIPFESPFVIGQRMSYPFLTNLLPALLVLLGVDFFQSFVVFSFLGSLATVISLFLFYKAVFGSRAVAILGTCLFFFNGGVGFIYYLQDVFAAESPIQALLNYPGQLTDIGKMHIRWISVINSMILPQRSFNLGFPVALCSLLVLWKKRKAIAEYVEAHSGSALVPWRTYGRSLGIAVVGIGLLPLIHTHSFLAVFIILACWSTADVFFRKATHSKKSATLRKNFLVFWLIVAIGVAIISLPLIKVFFFGQVSQSSFIEFYPGWLAKEFGVNWFVFWWKNWTIVPLTALVGYVIWVRNAKQKMLRTLELLPFFVIFVLVNLFLFQPWAWDNTKLLVWASLGFSGITAYFLIQMLRAIHHVSDTLRSFTTQALVAALFLFMIFSGAVDAYWTQRVDMHNYVMYTNEERQLAEWARNNTPKDSVWASDTRHNNWVYNLAGRQVLLAYPGWVWSYGYDYGPIERELKGIYQGDERQLEQVVSKYNIEYIVVNMNHPMSRMQNNKKLDQLFSLAHRTAEYQVYQRKK